MNTFDAQDFIILNLALFKLSQQADAEIATARQQQNNTKLLAMLIMRAQIAITHSKIVRCKEAQPKSTENRTAENETPDDELPDDDPPDDDPPEPTERKVKAGISSVIRRVNKFEALLFAVHFATNYDAEFDVSDALLAILEMVEAALIELDQLEMAA